MHFVGVPVYGAADLTDLCGLGAPEVDWAKGNCSGYYAEQFPFEHESGV